MKIPIALSTDLFTGIASNFGRLGCYFFLLLLSMYDKAAKITNNKVKTSIVFIGHHPLFSKTRGHITSENRIRFSVQLYNLIVSDKELLFKQMEIAE